MVLKSWPSNSWRLVIDYPMNSIIICYLDQLWFFLWLDGLFHVVDYILNGNKCPIQWWIWLVCFFFSITNIWYFKSLALPYFPQPIIDLSNWYSFLSRLHYGYINSATTFAVNSVTAPPDEHSFINHTIQYWIWSVLLMIFQLTSCLQLTTQPLALFYSLGSIALHWDLYIDDHLMGLALFSLHLGEYSPFWSWSLYESYNEVSWMPISAKLPKITHGPILHWIGFMNYFQTFCPPHFPTYTHSVNLKMKN